MRCRIVDTGEYVACLTHDVQAVPLWPDMMSSSWSPSDYTCPVVDELPEAYGRVVVDFGIRADDGRVIEGPGWLCVSDVVAAVHYHDLPVAGDHGVLVRRVNGGPWQDVAS